MMKKCFALMVLFSTLLLCCVNQPKTKMLNTSPDTNANIDLDLLKSKFRTILKWRESELKPSIEATINIIELSRLIRDDYPGKEIISVVADAIKFSQKFLSNALDIESDVYNLFIFFAMYNTDSVEHLDKIEQDIDEALRNIDIWYADYGTLSEKYFNLDALIVKYNITY